MTTPETCATCGVELISRYWWDKNTPEQRAQAITQISHINPNRKD